MSDSLPGMAVSSPAFCITGGMSGRLTQIGDVDRTAAEDWIRAHVDPVGAIETAHERPWSTVLRVPLADGVAWFKACAPVQAFEPRLTAELFARWPDRLPGVLGHDEERAWLLLADAGTPIRVFGNPPEAWLAAVPLCSELQRGEVVHAHELFLHGELPLEQDELRRLREFAPRFAELCAELAAHDVPETIQHDDLHHANVYTQGEQLRLLDWGDSSVAHPFFSLVVTFRFLEEINELAPSDPWFARLRDAYLEPWGSDHEDAFTLAMRVGKFAHAFAWARQRDALPPEEHPQFDEWYRVVIRRALAETGGD